MATVQQQEEELLCLLFLSEQEIVNKRNRSERQHGGSGTQDGDYSTLVQDTRRKEGWLQIPLEHCAEPHLPLSSLRLLVPPLRLMSACMWQVAQERIVDRYETLAQFITLVTEMVPDLLSYKQRTQLVLGLRARLILELLKKMDKVGVKAFQNHLNSFQQRTTNHVCEEDQDAEVEISKSAFVELVQILLRDELERDKFFKEVFPALYGPNFDTALQILVWEFFYRLEEFLPVPSFSQVFSTFNLSTLDYKFEQFVSEDLKRILQHQQERQKLPKSEFTFTSDTILSTLATKKTLVASEDELDPRIDEGSVDVKHCTDEPQGRNQEESEHKTLLQGNSCEVEVTCEDGEETDDSSVESETYGQSPLSSSPGSEDAGDSETASESSLQPPTCSDSSVEGAKEHLDLRRNEEEESPIRPSTGSRADVSLPFSKTTARARENTCLECGKTFASRSSLENHNHSFTRPFKCTRCDKKYGSGIDLKQHLLLHSNPAFACSRCEKRFSSQSLLKVHLRRHRGEKPFPCSYCGKRFPTNSLFKSHVRIHAGKGPYASTLCNKKLRRTVHLRMHMKEKPYGCSTCCMSFCSSEALLDHSHAHTGERPYQCESCKKGFASAVKLALHRRFHAAERPYPCSQCDKSFQSSSGLKEHMTTHTVEKPHECLICHKTFSQKSKMKIHLKVHKNMEKAVVGDRGDKM
ncbi:zinc finger protein 239-like isoform X1 [Brachyistius frenatus]|uniref:zinc finger protein 239-like isoform X1 n=1 Tax=Brachyistius frenatus TaxID=100188 RepID=UPI0037E72B93